MPHQPDQPDQPAGPEDGGRRVRRVTLWGVSTLSALVLLFSYRTSTGGSAGGLGLAAPAAGAPAATAPGPSPGSSGTSGASGSTGSTGAASTSGTFTGQAADTRWGPVQVQITVQGGRITAVTTVQQPDGNSRDEEINAQALPLLRSEVLQAQSAQIDVVSGATVTSDGYVTSLQSAIDAAHLGS